MNQKSKRGGRRPGAGRKPRAFPAKAINVKVDEPLFVRFREHCKAAGISQAKVVARWIEENTKGAHSKPAVPPRNDFYHERVSGQQTRNQNDSDRTGGESNVNQQQKGINENHRQNRHKQNPHP